MLNPWILLALAVAWAASIAGTGWKAYGAGQDNCEAKHARDRTVAAIATDAAASAAADAIAKIKVTNRTFNNEVQRDVVTKEVYRSVDCRHDADSLRHINAAITGEAGAEPAGGGKLPQADAPPGPDVRRDNPQADRDRRPVP